MIINNINEYIYYRDALEYLRIIMGKTKLTKKKKQLLEEYKRLEEIHNNKIKRVLDKKINVKAIYKAKIFEYEDGKLDIVFVCDIDKNKECDKRYCSTDCCTHTLDKKYAKNFIGS